MSYRSVQHPPVQHIELDPQSMNLPKALRELRNADPIFGGRICTHDFERGDTIANAVELKRQMYVLMQGQIHLVYDNAGRRLVVTTLAPGAIFGEGALNSPGEVSVVAEAATDGIVWSVPASEARSMAIQYPILGWGLLQTYGTRLQQVEDSLEDVAYKRLPDRLAGLLVGLSHGENGSLRDISHQELADRLGTYRETISAMLREFKHRGLVESGYRRIDIVDVEALKEVAGIWE